MACAMGRSTRHSFHSVHRVPGPTVPARAHRRAGERVGRRLHGGAAMGNACGPSRAASLKPARDSRI
jgi:hypothetical protein